MPRVSKIPQTAISIGVILLMSVVLWIFLSDSEEKSSSASSVFDFSEKDIHGREYSFEQDRGKVMLFVNVASG